MNTLLLNPKDLKVDVLFHKLKGQVVFPHRDQFVRIEHIPSGITVTKHSTKSQIRARDEGLEELEMLVEIWEDGQ